MPFSGSSSWAATSSPASPRRSVRGRRCGGVPLGVLLYTTVDVPKGAARPIVGRAKGRNHTSWPSGRLGPAGFEGSADLTIGIALSLALVDAQPTPRVTSI
jgi:hypothetical protein